jgi:multicomponent Na+:H+ antiporter subunit B
MTRRARLSIFACAGAGLAALLFWSLVGLPDFGHYHWPYGLLLDRIGAPARHTSNVVGETVFDIRGLDTLGEEFILFTAVTGVVLLLRKRREEGYEPRDVVRSDPIRLLGLLAAPLVLVLGLWVIAFGYVTPGGGFQGGVVVAAAFLLVYLAAGYRHFTGVVYEEPAEMAEAIGAGGFAVLGFLGIIWSGSYLGNFLGHGRFTTLYSGGSIPLVNWAVGLEVAAAMVVLFDEFLKTYMVPARDWRPGT